MTPQDKKRVKELTAEIKALQEKLTLAKKREGIDEYISVVTGLNQAHADTIKQRGVADKHLGKFLIGLSITAAQLPVYIPLSVASGKKTAGFMYHIEGTAEGSIVAAEVRVRGKGISQIKVGTLLYAKVPVETTASFELRITIRGSEKKSYRIAITRINYKTNLTDTRYHQYLKEIPSRNVTFS